MIKFYTSAANTLFAAKKSFSDQARKLVDFVGMEWDDACLSFHQNRRAVVTASHHQVRQPIYNTSVGRWKRYGPKIMPLVEALSDFMDGSEHAAI